MSYTATMEMERNRFGSYELPATGKKRKLALVIIMLGASLAFSGCMSMWQDREIDCNQAADPIACQIEHSGF